MINKDVYTLSMHLLGLGAERADNLDFYNRAPYLLALFCMEQFELDRHLRAQLGFEEIEELDRLCLDMNEDFPFLDCLAPAAALYLSSMLILEENEELYEKLYERYCDLVSSLQSGLPFELESIENLYFAD